MHICSQIYYGWNSNTFRETKIKSNTEVDTPNDIRMNYLNDRKSKFNDEILKDIGNTELSPSNNKPIYIFAVNANGSVDYKLKIKLYEFKISQGRSVSSKENYTVTYYITADEPYTQIDTLKQEYDKDGKAKELTLKLPNVTDQKQEYVFDGWQDSSDKKSNYMDF